MEDNMFVNTDTVNEEKKPSGFAKTWEYTEKLNKHSIHHTLSVNSDRLTHISEVREAAQAMRQRRDIKLSDVRAVHTYYGMSRNIPLVILLAVLAVFSLIIGIVSMADEGFTVVSLLMILLCGGLGFLAYWVYTKVKPSFVLEIDMYIPANKVLSESFSYGNASLNFGKKGIFARFKANKNKFIMDSATGNDIVDTLGEYLIH